jgi:hypothetical protein
MCQCYKESRIEAYCREQVKAHGGLMLKWVSPGTIGVPDNVVLWPGGEVHFVEFKAAGKKLTPMQARMLEKLRELGQQVFVIYDRTVVDEYVRFR